MIHTHDDSGVLHMEQRNPTNETLKLGYFFHNVWNKTLNSTCIFEYCANATHELKMWVNGKTEDGFDDFIMHDGGIIIIVYTKYYALVAQF